MYVEEGDFGTRMVQGEGFSHWGSGLRAYGWYFDEWRIKRENR